jgi:glyoxylase-like metal-dependent hydrolase (beta-lactamase superfamily II)
MHLHHFTLNPFLENTYLVWDDTGQCAIVDPGMYLPREQQLVQEFIRQKGLQPVLCLNTHCHIDHVFGNAWVHRTYGLLPQLPEAELVVLQAAPVFGEVYGFPFEPSPQPEVYLQPGSVARVGDIELEVLSVPGHSPGHVAFWHPATRQVLAGDVLFQGSIGRTDLPGGDMDTLMHSIFDVLLPLGDDVTVHPGHGNPTTLGQERQRNVYLREWMALHE